MITTACEHCQETKNGREKHAPEKGTPFTRFLDTPIDIVIRHNFCKILWAVISLCVCLVILSLPVFSFVQESSIFRIFVKRGAIAIVGYHERYESLGSLLEIYEDWNTPIMATDGMRAFVKDGVKRYTQVAVYRTQTGECQNYSLSDVNVNPYGSALYAYYPENVVNLETGTAIPWKDFKARRDASNYAQFLAAAHDYLFQDNDAVVNYKRTDKWAEIDQDRGYKDIRYLRFEGLRMSPPQLASGNVLLYGEDGQPLFTGETETKLLKMGNWTLTTHRHSDRVRKTALRGGSDQ